MANRIQIRHGNIAPSTNDLLNYELGWDYTNHVLYIKEESGNLFRIGGSSVPASSITGTLSVAQGGIGLTTSTNVNAIITGNSTTATDAFTTIRTDNGALYATSQDGVAIFGTLPVAQGGTGATSFTANSLIISGSTTTSALTTRGITNNGSATAAAAGLNIPTMNTLYYALPNINNSKSYTSDSTFYAPTAGGTAGYILTGNGTTSAPVWIQTLPVANGGTGQTSIADIRAGKDGDGNTISSTYLKLSGGTMTGDLSLKNNNIDITALSAIEDYYNNLFFKDTNNLNSAYVQNSQDTDGTISLTLASIHRDTDDSDDVNNTLTLSATDSDTAITVSHPNKWREGLKICKYVGTLASGGTLSFSDVDKYTFYMSCSASNGYVWYGMKRSDTSILFRGYNQTSDYAYAVTNSVTINGTTLTASSTLTYRNGSKQSDNHPAIGDVYAIA